MQDGHGQHIPPRHQPQRAPNTVTVVGIPSVSIQNNKLVVGDATTSSTRSYTPIKVLGNGSFGTVWLCDWHGTLPPGTPLSPMQCGASARPQYAGKRLVAVKLMKKRWEGGWDECKKNKELESLRAIPFHPNIIPLYDFFVLPDSRELYFVFESMEGNLYHLIKTRKGRPLAGGLVSSIFHQISLGLDHIHANGYFHRDMKPENVLVTTTGLFDYTSVSRVAPPNAPKEKDVIAIIKLADFGLARETNSAPPYTEYVSTRWYRAPEVLLFSRDYSNPVDMWAFGTIMAELVNLKPLFPGQDQRDQIGKICEILGDPSDNYGFDSNGVQIGGGPWVKGNDLASSIGFAFPQTVPKNFYALFEEFVPISLIGCIRDLLRYDPDKRLTSRQCLVHPYLKETLPRNNIPFPAGLQVVTSQPYLPSDSSTASYVNGSHSYPSLASPPHVVPASHSRSAQSLHHPQQYPSTHTTQHIPYPIPAPQSHFTPVNPITAHNEYRQPPPLNGTWSDSQGDYPMDGVLPHDQSHSFQHINGYPVEVHDSPMAQDPPPIPEPVQESTNTKSGGKLGTPLHPKKKNGRWASMFGGGDKSHHTTLPPVDESSPAIIFPSRKRTQSSSTDSRSLRDSSPVREAAQDARDAKKASSLNKKEAQRLHREAELEKRKLAERSQREMARAVMDKRQRILQNKVGDDITWAPSPEQRLDVMESQGKNPSSGPVRRDQGNGIANAKTHTIGAAANHFMMPPNSHLSPLDQERAWRGPSERIAKVRRREYDDDHSMSSSDVHSISRMSSISFATVDSDPGPSRLRNRPSLYNMSRMTSRSSLRTSFDDFPPSARSSNSFSLESQLAHDFRTQASVGSHLSGSLSPPPLQMLSLSPTMSPSLSPSPPWIQVQHHKEDYLSHAQSPPYISASLGYHTKPNGPHSPSDFSGQLPPPSPYGLPLSSYGYPPSSGHTPKSAKSVMNPMFKVPPLPPPPLPPPPTGDRIPSPNILPPFSEMEAAAGGELPPLSPMIFTTPEDA